MKVIAECFARTAKRQFLTLPRSELIFSERVLNVCTQTRVGAGLVLDTPRLNISWDNLKRGAADPVTAQDPLEYQPA